MLSTDRLKEVVRELNAKTLVISRGKLFCSVCQCSVSRSRKQKIEQHLTTEKHKKNLNKIYIQSLLITNSSFTTQAIFNKEISTAFIRANIPLNKLLNSNLKEFFSKFTSYSLPNPSTLRKNYITPQYKEMIQQIRMRLGDKKIWVCIDTSKDLLKRDIAIVVVGILNQEFIETSFLLNLAILEHSNSDTIARLFTDSLQILYPDGIQYDNVLLYLSDGAPYMKKSYTHLKSLYNSLVHVTCLAHMLHLIAEEARKFSYLANEFTNHLKKIFKKSPTNISIFKNLYPNLPLPPETVVTRWGTWIISISYVLEHFEELKDVLDNINSDSSFAVFRCKEILNEDRLYQEMLIIHNSLSTLPEYINKLEANRNILEDYSKIVSDFKQILETQTSELSRKLKGKLEQVLVKNTGFNELCKLQRFINGERVVLEDNILKNSVFYRLSKCTSVEVERKFSTFKDFLTDKKLSMTDQFIKEMFVILANKDVQT